MGSKKKNNENPTASFIVFFLSFLYLIIYYIQFISSQKGNSISVVIEDIPMMFNAFFYIIVFIICYILYREKKVGIFYGVFVSTIAIIDQIVVIISFWITTSTPWIFVGMSIVVILFGFF